MLKLELKVLTYFMVTQIKAPVTMVTTYQLTLKAADLSSLQPWLSQLQEHNGQLILPGDDLV
jgi:hypothetical protein